MTPRTLTDWLSYAERVHPVGIDMGLDRVREVAVRLDVLAPAKQNVVIAGTNGKGSTSIYLEALLLADGYTVGTTLSPHLNRFNERVRVNGACVDDEVLSDAFASIEHARGAITLTYFEFGILAALLVFKRSNVDVTVLEVGLGGRLDAVNIVTGSVTVITSIGIDHVAYLGPDRESIGAEKAGILRRGVPCVYGEASIPTSIVDAARTIDAPLLRKGRDFNCHAGRDGWDFDGVCGGRPVHLRSLARPSVALDNAATALQALLLLDARESPADLVAAAARARLPGRFEHFDYRGLTLIVDVAHNPHGAAFLSEQLRATQRDGLTIAVAGFLQDKDAAGIVAALDPAVDEWVFVDTEGARGQAAQMSAQKVRSTRPVTVATDVLEHVIAARATQARPLDRVIVLGCFDLAQRARAIMLRDGVRR
ncbi:MAG TPA: bifunctional tetrahydrofolate synthase/dihydrofolate synthase [Pseudomonadales bacterium]